MAVNLQQGTLNPLSSTLAKDLMDGFTTGMTAAIAAGKTNWSIVDLNYTSGTTVRTVFTNTAGFAIMMLRSTTLSVTTVNLFLGQSYNAGTHTLNNIGFGWSANILSASDGFSGSNFNPTSIPGIFGSTPAPSGPGILFTATTSQTNWSLHVEDSSVGFSFKDGSATSGKAMWAGAFTSLVSNTTLTDTYPFALISFTLGNNSNFANVILHSLNNPSVTITHCATAFSFNMDSAPALPASYDKYSLNPSKAKLSNIYIARGARTPLTDASTYGWLRGYIPNAFHGFANNAAWGDTVSIDGKSYMFVAGGTDVATVANTNVAVWFEV